ncbi:MAG: hypothetical protein HC828_13980, partial [Blastochloris sp.]|nr:hypothetical protein [Blastochloris sp.]
LNAQVYGNSNITLLMLIAAYGGLPFDYRSSPPELNLTAAETVDATRQVLELVERDLIILDDSLLGSTSRIYVDPIGIYQQFPSTEYTATTFPVGSMYNPVSYNLHTLYINAQTAYPEACYEWMTHLLQNAYLFPGISLNDPDINENIQNVLNQFTDLLTQPNTISFPFPVPLDGAISQSHLVELQRWREAIDAAAAGDDLLSVLSDAEAQIFAYRSCLSLYSLEAFVKTCIIH